MDHLLVESMGSISLNPLPRETYRENAVATYHTPEGPGDLDAMLRKAVTSSGWPFWNTVDFTLAMDKTRHLRISKDHYKHLSVFKQATEISQELMAWTVISEETRDAYLSFTSRCMAQAIYGSNMQEKAGLGLEYTMRACDVVFSGAGGDAATVQKQIEATYEDDEERWQAYEVAIGTLRYRDIKTPSMKDVRRARKEVIQHAQAMLHIVRAMLRGEELSETLIKETHRILCHGISKDGDLVDAPTTYEGVYRDTEARAGSTMFTPARHVPREMHIFIEDFKDHISGDLDPFYLAADVSQDFITIHPFEDGNGRMGRLLMNAFLMKYAGIVVVIGITQEDRRQYLAIMEEAGDGETEEAAKSKLAKFILGKAVAVLDDLRRRICEDGSR
jgi:fido (protein-threonine AMPylation protein)